MKLRARITLLFLISFLCVGCDQSTKFLASEYLSPNFMESYFYDILRLGYTENIGAFLGFGSQFPDQFRFLVFTVLVGFFLIGFLFYLMFDSTQGFLPLTGLSLMFAGGSSNFFDRLMNDGAVVDFLNIGIGLIRTGIFNVADVAIFCGCLLFFFSEWRQYRKNNC